MNTRDEEFPKPIKWTKPDPRVIKINCDASMSAEDGVSGLVAVAGNSGDLIIDAAEIKTKSTGILAAEMDAILMGLQLAARNGCESIPAESDSGEAIQSLQVSTADCYWEVNAIVHHIKALTAGFSFMCVFLD